MHRVGLAASSYRFAAIPSIHHSTLDLPIARYIVLWASDQVVVPLGFVGSVNHGVHC